MKDRAILSRAAAELRPYRARLLWSMITVFVRSVLLVLPPLMTKQIIDVALAQGDRGALWLYAAAGAGVMVVAVFLILADVMAASYVQQVSLNLRTRLFQNLLARPLSYFGASRTGKLMARLLQESQAFTSLFFGEYGSGVLGTFGWAVTTGSIALIAMLWLDPSLAAIYVVLYALQLAAIRWVGGLYSKVGREEADARAALTETIRESVTGIGYVKASGLEGVLTQQVDERLARLEAAGLRRLLLLRFSIAVDALPELLATGLLFFLGGYRVMTGDLSLGGLVAFSAYAVWLQGPISVLAELYTRDVKRLLPEVERTFTFLDEVPEPAGSLRPAQCSGALTFDRVTFGYDPDRPVLRDFSLTVEPGEVVAVVGPSGAGKSTLADLATALQQPQAGQVMLDGHDLKELAPDWVRQLVCAVAQDVTVLNATLAENVRYGRPDAPEAEVLGACTAAAVDFTEQMPNGMDTLVGERGAQLSGGQRQRVSIARALLYEPQVLILDEATSTLDAATESRVMAGLQAHLAGRTMLIIAHRLSTITHADRILVLEQGQVVEQGSHADLMARGGQYFRLYTSESASEVSG